MSHNIYNLDRVGYAEGDGVWWATGDLKQQAIQLTKAQRRLVTAAAERLGMNYPVEEAPLFTKDHNGVFIPVKIGKLIRRGDQHLTPFKLAGNDYRIIDGSMLFEFAQAILDELGGDGQLRTMGTLKNGAVAWALIDLPDRKIAGEPHYNYILVVTSHDGTITLQAGPVDERVVCANTMAVALGEHKEMRVKVRHSGDVAGKASEAHRVLMNSLKIIDGWAENIELLATVPAKPETVRNFMEFLIPIEAVIQPVPAGAILASDVIDLSRPADRELVPLAVRRATEKRETLQHIYSFEPSTLKGLLDAATGYVDHGWQYRSGGMNAADKRFANRVLGNGAKMKEEALDWLLSAAKSQ